MLVGVNATEAIVEQADGCRICGLRPLELHRAEDCFIDRDAVVGEIRVIGLCARVHVTWIENDHVTWRDRYKLSVAYKIAMSFLDQSDHVIVVFVRGKRLDEAAIGAALTDASKWRDGARRLVHI